MGREDGTGNSFDFISLKMSPLRFLLTVKLSTDSKKITQPVNKPRTKAAMKEFTQYQQHQQIKKLTEQSPKSTVAKKPPTKTTNKKPRKDPTTDLIVPQRQAAKKATQNLTSKSSSSVSTANNTSITSSTFNVDISLKRSKNYTDNVEVTTRNQKTAVNVSRHRDIPKKEPSKKSKQAVSKAASNTSVEPLSSSKEEIGMWQEIRFW